MNRPNADLFVIGSPFQLLNATEAALYFSDSHPKILIIVEGASPKADVSIPALLKLYKWKKIIRVASKKRTKFITQLFVLLKLRRSVFRHVFISDLKGWYFQLPLALNLKKSGKLFLLDDGAATIVLQNNYLPYKKVYEYKDCAKQDDYKKRIFRFLGLNTELREVINLFTIFKFDPLPGQTIIQNKLSLLCNLLKKQSSYNSESIFIGAGLVGKVQLMTEEDYLQRLTKVSGLIGEPILYYAHRTENEDLLSKISLIPGFNVNKSKYFIELELILNKIKPKRIISFWSTSMFTLNMLFPDAEIYMLEIERKDLIKDYFDEVQLVYSYYNKNLPLQVLRDV